MALDIGSFIGHSTADDCKEIFITVLAALNDEDLTEALNTLDADERNRLWCLIEPTQGEES